MNATNGDTTRARASAGDLPVTPEAAPCVARPLRLSLVPAGSGRTLIDGAWWPYSRDLTAELPALAGALGSHGERITRVTVNPARWPVVPRRVPVEGHVLKVGWFTEQDPDLLMLLSYRPGRWDLLVVPPETDSETAAWLLAAAADPLRTSAPCDLVDEAVGRREADRTAAGESAQRAVWDSEGGQAPHGPIGART